LRGVHAFEHIPWVLRLNGYYTANFSGENLSNPALYNLANGFSQINDQRIDMNAASGKLAEKIRAIFYEEIGLLTDITDDLKLKLEYSCRISDTLKTRKEIALVNYGSISFDAFSQKLDHIIGTESPFLVHFHSVVTHTPIYRRKYKKFSSIPDAVEDKCVAMRKKNRTCSGRRISKKERMAMYDDTLLQMDEEVERIFKLLEKKKIADNTLFILTTDHEYEWKASGHPVALVMCVPGHEKGRIIGDRVSLLDIAPTIIDLLGLKPMKWLEGRSLKPYFSGKRPAGGKNRFFHISKGSHGKLSHVSVLNDHFRIHQPVDPVSGHVFFDISNGYRESAKKVKRGAENKIVLDALKNEALRLIH